MTSRLVRKSLSLQDNRHQSFVFSYSIVFASKIQYHFGQIFVGTNPNHPSMFHRTWSCIYCIKNGILLPKLFWPTVRKNCSIDWEKLLKSKAEAQDIWKIFKINITIHSHYERREQFMKQNAFLICSWRFLIHNEIEQ